MIQQNIPTWMYFAIIFALLVIAGIAEYLKMIPAGTFGYIFAVALGLIAPSPISVAHQHDNTTLPIKEDK
jgi:hypothetical protein